MLILGIINLYFTLEITQQSNDECLWVTKRIDKDKVGIFFDLVKENGVTWEAGIRNGDRLIAINGVEIRNSGTAQFLLNQIAAGDSAYYLYESEGEEFESYVEIKKLVSFGSLAIVLSAIIWLLVGFITIKSKPDGELQLLFYKIGVYFSLFACSSLLANNFNSNPLYEYPALIFIIILIWIFAASYLPFYIIRFFWMFPKKLQLLDKIFIQNILHYTPRAIFYLSAIILILQSIGLLGNTFYISPNIVNFYLSTLFSISIGIGFISLIYSYFKLKTAEEKRPIFVIVISYALAVSALIYSSTFANQLAQTIFNEPEYFFPILVVAVLPLSFGYSVFKYSLMDVGDVVKNAIFYGILTVSLAAAYFLVIYILGLGISSAISTEYQGLIAGIIFVFFAILFQNTKDKFQEYITQKFYPEQFASHKILLKFSSEIPTVVGMENVLNYAQEVFIDSLRIKKYAVYLKQDGKSEYNLLRSYGINLLPQKFVDVDEKILTDINSVTDKNNYNVIEQEKFSDVLPGISDELIEDKVYTIIPLYVKSRVIGLLLFGVKYSGARFAGKDLELLTAAANQISISLENARLYESEAEKMKLEHDLENARKIQESLLPKTIPSFPNLQLSGSMIPAMQVGGDYYDVIKVSDDKLFVIVGDVSGKGLSASFYMSKLQTMIKLYCEGSTSPKEVLIKVNKNIYENIERNWFITVAVGLFDLNKKTMKYCRAGHTPLIETNKTDITLYQSKGIGVGLEKGDIFDSSLEEIEIELKSDHNFIFYSDGVTETMNEQNELFGMERFEEMLIKNSHKDSDDILNNTIETLKQFRSKAHQNDDITLVIAKCI
jgi:sigma-B regulation protein RsbU (phosphoserine phosphatase)